MADPDRPTAGKTYWDIVLGEFRKNRLGVAALAGVVVLFALAVAAPFLANGLPYRIVVDGRTRWPLFAALSRTELTVLLAGLCAAAAVVAVLLVRRRRNRGDRAVRMAALIPLGVFVVGTAAVANFRTDRSDHPDAYRALIAAGRAHSAVYAPIPFGYAQVEGGFFSRSPSFGADHRFDKVSYTRMSDFQVPAEVIAKLRPLRGERFDTSAELDARLAGVLAPSEAAAVAGAVRTATESRGHFLGTDSAGGDVAARLVYGARTSLAVGFVAVSISVFIGVCIGATMGYFGGWVDFSLMRLMEIVMSIPTLFLIITIIAFWGGSLFNIMLVIGITTWPLQARFVRAEFLKLRKQDFVMAAQALGVPASSVMFRHMLPNGLAPTLVEATFGVGSAIFIEAALNFLGLGPGPEVPSWGAMLGEILQHPDSWWLSVFPGAAIFVTVLCYNLVGEGLRDAIDPRLRKAAS